MNGAAQLGLALNIDHLPFARSGSGCNTGGLPEHRRSEPEYRKTIHLSHFLAGGGNHHHTPADLLAASLPHPTGTILPFINGLLEVAGFDRIGACLASPMICLTQNVPEHPVVGGQFALVRRQPTGMLNQPGYRASLQRAHVQGPGHGCNHSGIDFVAFIVTVQIVLEIRLHLEQVQEVRVVMGQQVIQHPVAKQHHLDRHRNRLRLQTDGTHQPIQPLKGLDAYFTGRQNALQAFPCHRLCQHPAGINNQISATGPVHGTAANQSEVGIEIALAGPVFDLPGQVLVVGQVLVDNGRADGFGIIHQQIDLVAGQKANRWPVIGVLEGFGMFHHIFADRIQIVDNLRKVRPLLPQFADRTAQGQLHHLFIEGMDPLPHFFPHPGNLLNSLLQLFLKLLNLGFNQLLLFIGKVLVFLGVDHLAFAHGGEGETGRRSDHGNVVAVGLFLDLEQTLVLALGHFFLQFLQPGLVFLALKRRCNGRAQLLCQTIHVLLELLSLPRWQLDRARPV